VHKQVASSLRLRAVVIVLKLLSKRRGISHLFIQVPPFRALVWAMRETVSFGWVLFRMSSLSLLFASALQTQLSPSIISFKLPESLNNTHNDNGKDAQANDGLRSENARCNALQHGKKSGQKNDVLFLGPIAIVQPFKSGKSVINQFLPLFLPR
jgi:hypothetical protein